MKKYDDIIIGFGKGGKTLAGYLASTGRKVAMIEMDKGMYGGTCINVGCIPSKSLVTSGLNIKKAAAAKTFEQKAALYADAMVEKRRLTGMLRQKNYAKLADSPNIDVIDGRARFLSNTQVEVKTDSATLTLEAEHLFINTGSASFIPPIPGLKDNPLVHDSRSLMELDHLPRRLAIIGGGYIGLEFASMYTNFGSQVTVLQDLPAFAPREDQDVAETLTKLLTAKGINLLAGTKVQKVRQEGDAAVISYSQDGQNQELEVDAVLVATGRRPNIAGLNLEAAGVAVTSRGAVQTDDTLKTTAPNIWAMGDVTGNLQFTYTSLDDFRIVKSQLSGQGTYDLTKRHNVPFSVFIDPPFSRVGISEGEARAAGFKIKVAKLPAAAIPKAQVLRQPTGLLKAVIDEPTGFILGAALICEESYEMINLIKLAMDHGIKYTALRDMIYTHPTMSESLNDLFNV
jgi:pyruvate/2-oxoglutarate dehydrogenase complex dihydrolipoamide dehydrogenase (E3) component